MKKCLKKYLFNIRTAFPVYGKSEKRFFKDFKLAVQEYESTHPLCDENDLHKNFGLPKEVVAEYFNNMDSGKYLRLMRKSFYLRIVTLVAVFLLCVFFFIQTFSLYQLRKEAREAIITTEDIDIYYINKVD